MPKPTAAANAAPMPASSRRAFLKIGAALGTFAALAVPVVVLPKAEACTLDPAFAAVDALRARWAEVEALVEDHAVYEHARRKVPDELNARIAAAHERCDEAREDLLETVPTTAAGMLAMLDIIDQPAGWADTLMEEWEYTALRDTFRAFLMAGGANG